MSTAIASKIIQNFEHTGDATCLLEQYNEMAQNDDDPITSLTEAFSLLNSGSSLLKNEHRNKLSHLLVILHHNYEYPTNKLRQVSTKCPNYFDEKEFKDACDYLCSKSKIDFSDPRMKKNHDEIKEDDDDDQFTDTSKLMDEVAAAKYVLVVLKDQKLAFNALKHVLTNCLKCVKTYKIENKAYIKSLLKLKTARDVLITLVFDEKEYKAILRTTKKAYKVISRSLTRFIKEANQFLATNQ